jgi:hypothetical protein
MAGIEEDDPEELHWVREGEARLADFDPARARSHEEVWGPRPAGDFTHEGPPAEN